LDYQNNCVERSNMMSSAAKNFDIPALSLSVLRIILMSSKIIFSSVSN